MKAIAKRDCFSKCQCDAECDIAMQFKKCKEYRLRSQEIAKDERNRNIIDDVEDIAIDIKLEFLKENFIVL